MTDPDLHTLAPTLLTPPKILPTSPKRIRIRIHGVFVADTTTALYVWEPASQHPIYYVHIRAFVPGALSAPDFSAKDHAIYTLASCSERVLVFLEGKLEGFVRVVAPEVEWFEEDVKVAGHPRDPFKRVDVLFSTRRVRVFVGGEEVACAQACFHLYETGLPVRFYLPVTCVREGVLEESETRSTCPYKGEARYFDVLVKGERRRDLVWCYENPVVECAAIKGAVCFWNEKCDVELDGVMLERPKSMFS